MHYVPLPADDFEYATLDDRVERACFDALDGRPRLSGWRPLFVQLGAIDHGHASRRADFPGFSPKALLLRDSALSVLGDMLVRDGELLPMNASDGSTLHLFHVTRILDVLDYARSDIWFIPGTQRIMLVRRAVFSNELADNVNAFRLPFASSEIYVSAAFKKRVEQAKLQGIKFSTTSGDLAAPAITH